jgi:hypothetical protein
VARQQHGSGTLVVSENEMYEGAWHLGLMHGKGTYVWENGDRYFGDYKVTVAWFLFKLFMGASQFVLYYTVRMDKRTGPANFL